METARQLDATPSETGASFVRVPVKSRKGIVAWATVDRADESLVVGLDWHLSTDGYAQRSLPPKGRVKEFMARRILGLRPGDGVESDHISRDKLDNRRSNLRIVTHAQNSQNRVRTDGNSRYRGVSRKKDRKAARPFQAYGCAAGKQSHLGFYDEELDAARAAEAWRRVHLPFAVPDGSLDPLPSCPCRDCRAA